jgi:phage-related minor tail protein
MVENKIVIAVQYVQKGMEKIVKGLKKMHDASVKWKLSTMFFGYAMTRAFKGLTNASMDMMGVWGVLNSFLGTAFLPIAEYFLNVIMWLWDAWDALPEPIQKVVQALVLIMGIVGSFLGVSTALSMGIKGVTELFGFLAPIIGIIVAPALAIIAAIGILVGVFWLMDTVLRALGMPGLWQGVSAGIQVMIDMAKQAWIWIQLIFLVYIPNAIKTLVNWFTSLPDMIKSGIDNFVNNVRNGVNTIIDMFKNLPINIFNAITSLSSTLIQIGKDMISWLISGIQSMASNIANALWNILPRWLQNAISGVGTMAKTIVKAFGGLFPMQSGGIVTRPTPALIGERGPEAVIPLDRIGSIGGINITINTSSMGGNTDAIAREIAEKFSFELSRVRY